MTGSEPATADVSEPVRPRLRTARRHTVGTDLVRPTVQAEASSATVTAPRPAARWGAGLTDLSFAA